MTTKRATLEDGSILAATVRALARDAHRFVSNPTANDSAEVQIPLNRLALVRQHVRGTRARDLERWLDNLQRRLERARRPESVEAMA